MIAYQINNPRAYASRRCREIMFEGESYGVGLLGTATQVMEMTAQELALCYRSLISDHGYEFFYVGPRSLDEVADKIAEFFLPEVHTHSRTQIVAPTARSSVSAVRRVTEEMPLAQGKLVLGFRTGINLFSKDFYAMLVANEIYGFSPVSKLFMNVRERLGLCYYCSSAFDVFNGAVFVSCGISPCNKEKAETEILRQLKKMSDGEIEEAELIAAKHSLCNTYRSLGDSPALLESYYFCRNEFGIECSPSECMQNIQNVTPEEVITAASKISLDTVYFLNGNGEEGENAND
jgi:predicted Zn-dependent peptidase